MPRLKPGETLTILEAMFIESYLRHFNGTRAVIDAGFEAKRPNDYAKQMLAKPRIRDEVNRQIELRKERLRISADSVLLELHKVAVMPIDDAVAAKGLTAKVRAAEALLDYVGDKKATKLEVTGAGGGPIKSETKHGLSAETVETIRREALGVKTKRE